MRILFHCECQRLPDGAWQLIRTLASYDKAKAFVESQLPHPEYGSGWLGSIDGGLYITGKSSGGHLVRWRVWFSQEAI